MTSYQEQASLPAEDIKTSNLDYHQLVAELENKLQKSRRTLEQAESAYDAADEAVFGAESNAEENEKAYQTSHELLQTLLAEEESMRFATEMANSLASDASSLKTDKETNYSDLLHQAMSALITVSANAEQKLAEKRQQREKAQHQDQVLHLKAATSRLNAYTAAMRQAKTEYFRLHAANELELTENQYKLAKTRRELMDLLQQIKNGRKSLADNIAAYYSTIDEAEQLSEAAKRHQEELKELNENLSSTSAQIIPYETLVNDLQHDESSLLEAYSKAAEEAEAAYQQQVLLTKALEKAIEEEQEKERSAKDQLSELYELNKELTHNEEQRLKDAATAMANAADMAEQAQRELAENKAQIPTLEKELADSQEALEKAHSTAQETARMVANVQAVKFSMKENSTKVLSGAETVLQSTLEAANNMVLEKEAANSQAQQNLDETKEIEVFLQQAADEAQQAYETLSRAYDAIQTEQNQLREKIQQSEKQLNDITERQRSEAKNHRINIETELNDAEKFTVTKRKLTEELKQQLQELRIEYKKAVESRDEMKKQIHEINTRIEVEKMQETTDRENRIITLWENSEKLQMHIRESGQQLQRNIDNAHKLSAQEQRCIRALDRTLEQVNQSMEELHKQRILSMDDYESMVQELKEALDDYRQNPIAMLQESEYNATILAANLLLDNSKTANAEYIQKPVYYELKIGDCIDIASELVTAPIPQIDPERAEKSQALLNTQKVAEDGQPKDETANKKAAEIMAPIKAAAEAAAEDITAGADNLPPFPETKIPGEKQQQGKEALKDTEKITESDIVISQEEKVSTEAIAEIQNEQKAEVQPRDLVESQTAAEAPKNNITDSTFNNIPLTSSNPDLLNQLLDLMNTSQKHNQAATANKSTAAPITETAIPEEVANNHLPAKDSTDLLGELMTLIGGNAAQGSGALEATETKATPEYKASATEAAASAAIEPEQAIIVPDAEKNSAADHAFADNSPSTAATAASAAAPQENDVVIAPEQTSQQDAQKSVMDAAVSEQPTVTGVTDNDNSANEDRLLELMNLVGSNVSEGTPEPSEAEKNTIDQTLEEAAELYADKQLAEAAGETTETLEAPVVAATEDQATVEATEVAAKTTYNDSFTADTSAAPLPYVTISEDEIKEVVAQDSAEESSEMAADFEYLSGDFSYIDNSGDDLAQLLEDIATLRSGIERTTATAPAATPPQIIQESSSASSASPSTAPPTGFVGTPSPNTGRDIISNEISNLKHLLSGEEKERLEALDAAFKADQEEAARIESERLRREEEAAQLKAEQEAAARAIEEKKAAEEETKRLTRLAEEASKQFKQQLEEPQKLNETLSSSQDMQKDEDEDDLEAELRRIIFSDFR